jgi:hypothetical protein
LGAAGAGLGAAGAGLGAAGAGFGAAGAGLGATGAGFGAAGAGLGAAGAGFGAASAGLGAAGAGFGAAGAGFGAAGAGFDAAGAGLGTTGAGFGAAGAGFGAAGAGFGAAGAGFGASGAGFGTTVADFGASGWAAGIGRTSGGGVELGVEIFCCSFTSGGGFGVGKFDGLVCRTGVAAVTGFCASFGVAARSGVPGARGVFCPAGRLTVGLGVGPPVAGCRCDSGGAGVVEGLGAIRFGGVPFGTTRAGRFPLGGCLTIGEPVAPGWGGTPRVPGGFTGGEAFPKDFAPSKLGGTGLLPSVAAFGEPTGVRSGFGGRAPGFSKLGVFCPAAGVGPPVVSPGDPIVRPWLPICGFTKGVGLGWSFGGGFCSAMVLLSFSAS